IDLAEGQVIVVEVRTTRGTRFGYGHESVDIRKRRQVRRLALRYIQEKGLHHLPVRFDVISVLLGGDNRPKNLRHLEGAFYKGVLNSPPSRKRRGAICSGT